VAELPADVEFDPENPPAELPELPEGYTWGLKITASAEVIKAADIQKEN
jgi:hypothetical protein